MITQTPLLRTIKAYGQLLERDFNPLAKSLLLRTPDSIDIFADEWDFHGQINGFLLLLEIAD